MLKSRLAHVGIRLMQQPHLLLVFLAAYLALQVIVRLLLPHGLRYDEAQQALFSQWLAWGYDNQPPLYNWLQFVTINAFGLTLATISGTKNLIFFAAFAAYFWLAYTVLKSRAMVVFATLLLFTMPPVAWEAQRNLTHTIAQMVMVCLLLVCVCRTVRSPSIGSYLAIGVAIGLGMLTKYNFLLVVIGAIIATAGSRTGRARLLDWRMAITIAAAAIIVLPHGLWLLDNMATATERTMSLIGERQPYQMRQLLKGPFSLLLMILLFFSLTVVVLAALLRRDLVRCLRTSSEESRFFGLFFAASLGVLLVLILVMRSKVIEQHWLLPLFFAAPIYICAKLEAAGIKAEALVPRLIVLPLIVMLIVPCALIVRTNVPQLFGRRDTTNIPYARFIDQVVRQTGKTPGLILSDEVTGAGNVKYQLPDVPVMSLRFANLHPEFQLSAERPVLVVFTDAEIFKGRDRPELVSWINVVLGEGSWAGDAAELPIPYFRGRQTDMFLFRYRWIYPK